jgi:prevent-host-death family protein
MREVQISEAQDDFDRILDEVERGETIAITRNGRIIARLLPVDDEAVTVEDAPSARDEGRR